MLSLILQNTFQLNSVLIRLIYGHILVTNDFLEDNTQVQMSGVPHKSAGSDKRNINTQPMSLGVCTLFCVCAILSAYG